MSKHLFLVRFFILFIAITLLSLVPATRVLAPERLQPIKAQLPPPSAEALEIAEAFDAFIQQAIDQGFAPGAAAAVVYEGNVLLEKGYGVRSLKDSAPADKHTIFRIASLSKSFAAFLTGRMVQQGKVHWEDPVQKYLPDLCLQTDEHTRALQLNHLLSQSSGLPYHAYTDQIELGKPVSEIMPMLYDLELIGKPGKIYSYQNAVFSLAGEALQAATGLSYEENLLREVFQPLGMQDASASLAGFLNSPNAAMPHDITRAGMWQQLAPSPNYYNAAPAGGVNASASDMAQYLLAMLGNRPDVISKETLQKLGEPLVYSPVRYRYFGHWNNIEKVWYGLGWRVLDLSNGEKLLYHGGYVAGYRAEMAVHPEKGWGVCVMFNAAAGMADQCVPKFMELVEATVPPQL